MILKVGTWVSCNSITWGLLRNGDPCVPPQVRQRRNSGGRAQPSMFLKQITSGWFCTNRWDLLLCGNHQNYSIVYVRRTKQASLKCQIFPDSMNKVWPSRKHVQPRISSSEFQPICVLCCPGSDQASPTPPGGSMRAWDGQALLSWATCAHLLPGGRQKGSKRARFSDAGSLPIFHWF